MEYVVKGGDTLWDIAARLLGNGARWRELGYTGDPRKLPIGTKLSVPVAETPPQQAPVTAEEYISNVETSIEEQYKEVLPTEKDPFPQFTFDEGLAEQAATAEVSPYYDELLGDYMTNVDRKRERAIEDERTDLGILGERKEQFTRDVAMDYEIALEKAREGYAGRNLYFSGKRETTEGRLGEARSSKERGYDIEHDYQVGKTREQKERTLEDLEWQRGITTRDLEREKQYDIEKGVATRRGEQLQQHYLGAMQHYYGESGFGADYGFRLPENYNF